MFGRKDKAKETKKQLENWVSENLKDTLTLRNNRNLTLAFTAMFQGGSVLHCKDENLDADFTLAFSDENGIPNIRRYDVLEKKDIMPVHMENLSNMFGQKTEQFIETLKHDLCIIENFLMQAMGTAVDDLSKDDDYDISFVEISGISYGYYTEAESSTPSIRVTALLDTDEDGDPSVIFKYSTDNAINMAFKNDATRVSLL